MSAYALPIFSAFLIFAVIAFLGTAPWAIYQYRKYGYFSFWRNLILFSFIYYCLTAFFLVSLPLPTSRNNIEFKQHTYIQLHPFNMLTNFKQVPGFEATNPKTYLTLFKSFTFLEVFFNVALFFPLGVYLRYFLKKGRHWFKALLIIFSGTLFFEVSQLTGLFGYYAYPYRLFDVDDLLMNTLGGMLGFIVAPLLLQLIPSRDQLHQQDLNYSKYQRASYGSQLLEVVISLFFSQLIGGLVSSILWKGNAAFIFNFISAFFFLVILPLLTDGKTIGGKVIRLKLTITSHRKIQSLLFRFMLIVSPSLLGQVTQKLTSIQTDNVYLIIAQLVFSLINVTSSLIFFFIILIQWMRKKDVVFFNRLATVTFIRD